MVTLTEHEWFINKHKSFNVMSYKCTFKQKYMIISIDVEKSLDKTQHAFMIKVIERTGLKGNIST